MVLGIAHQVSGRLLQCAPEMIRRTASVPQKIRMAPCRTSIPLPFPTDHAGSCLVDQHAMPSADVNQVQSRRTEDDGTRKLC
jgi:hypothetical protein